MQDTVEPSERITRYLRNSGHLRPGLGRPHFSAYLPQVENGDISVYRTSGLVTAEIRALGVDHVEQPGTPLKGHCDLQATEFFAEALNIVSAPNPHERHANVTGWTIAPRNRVIARKLADKATLTVYE